LRLDNFHNWFLVNMNRAFWLFLSAVSLSFFALNLMLDSPPAQRDRQVRTDSSGRPKSEAAKNVQESVGFPAVSGKSQSAGKPRHKLPQTPTASNSQTASEEDQPEELTPSEDPVADGEIIDMQEVEERMLAEQLAESLRNPAYLSGAAVQLSAPIDPEDSMETEEGATVLQEDESSAQDELAESEDEELPDDIVSYPPEEDETISEENQVEEQEYATEADFPVDDEMVDTAEIEDQMMNAQIEESRKKPAHLQALPERPVPEETEPEETENED